MRRAGVLATKAVAVVALVAALAGAIVITVAPGPSELGSSYATSATGLSVYARLLRRTGHPVLRLDAAPSKARLDLGATLVVLDPSTLVYADVLALRRFVAAGGLLVAGGSGAGSWVPELLPDPPGWSPSGQRADAPIVPTAQTRGVSQVISAGQGAWTSPGGTLPILGYPSSSLAAVAAIGRGSVVLLADSSPLQNRYLAQGDNAELGLALAGGAGRTVVFEEGVHGYGSTDGLASLPTRWKWLLAGLLCAAALGVTARFRRLAPPAPRGAPAFPRRREHVDALASALARTRRPGAAAAAVAERGRAELRRRGALGPGADGDALRAVGARYGLAADELRALTASELADGDVLAAGRALAKLTGAPR
jgi:Domain of unknown function (DUF4350)